MRYFMKLLLCIVVLSCITITASCKSENKEQAKSKPDKISYSKQTPKENKLTSEQPEEYKYAPPTNEQKMWALATSAILTESNGCRHDILGGNEHTPEMINAWLKVLSEWWDINNRAELLESLSWIEEEGHRSEFDKIMYDIESATPQQFSELRVKLRDDPELQRQMDVVLNNCDKLGKKSIIAWDYARYVSLCRWGYLVGFITEDEAWQRIMPAANLMQNTFESWEDLGNDYLIGREFWSPSQTDASGDIMQQSYQKLLTDPASPWLQIAWDMDLTPPNQ